MVKNVLNNREKPGWWLSLTHYTKFVYLDILKLSGLGSSLVRHTCEYDLSLPLVPAVGVF